jgi:hypothetical protein
MRQNVDVKEEMQLRCLHTEKEKEEKRKRQ